MKEWAKGEQQKNPNEKTAVRLIRNERATEPTAIPPISFSGKRNQRPKMPFSAAPASGRSGTSQMYLYMKTLIRLEAGYGPPSLGDIGGGGGPPQTNLLPLH